MRYHLDSLILKKLIIQRIQRFGRFCVCSHNNFVDETIHMFVTKLPNEEGWKKMYYPRMLFRYNSTIDSTLYQMLLSHVTFGEVWTILVSDQQNNGILYFLFYNLLQTYLNHLELIVPIT